MEQRTPTVLVIDDQEVNLRLMRVFLSAEHYQVITCDDPEQALRIVEREPPDLVLLDLIMPVLDGFVVLEFLKDTSPQVPVVVITGLNDRDARLRGLAAGARDFLTKPVDRSELLIRVRNLTDLKRAGDSLAEAVAQLKVANGDLEAFAGGLAHDLQQPITSIARFAQTMLSAAPHSPDDDLACLKAILAAADSAQCMIRGLLEFARLGQRKLEAVEVDLNQLLEEARGALASEMEGREVTWMTADLPVVRGDPGLLLLAFVNLLSNSLKYSRARERPSIQIDFRSNAASGYEVRIRDNGVGFDMACADRLFNPFERLHRATEFEGTGMGLANVRRIMERHGGSVHAESAPGQGATFTLVFRS